MRLSFDVLATDRATPVFERVGKTADRLTRQVKGLDRVRAVPKVALDTKAATGAAAAMRRDLSKLETKKITLPVGLQRIDAQMSGLRGQLEQLASKRVSVPVDLRSGVDAQAKAVKAQLATLERQRVKVPVDLGRADAEIGVLKAQLATLERPVTVPVRVRPPKITVPVDVDAARLQAASRQFASLLKLPALAAGASIAGGAIASLTAGVVSLGAAAAPAVGGMAGVGAAGAALGQGFLVAKFATSGLGDAMKAVNAVNQSTAAGFAPTAAQVKKVAIEYGLTSAAGQRLVRVLLEQSAAWSTLKDRVQGVLLPQLATSIQTLGSAYLPMLTRATMGTAGVLRDLAAQATRAFSSAVWRQDVDRILTTNTGLLGTLSRAAVPLANVVRNIWVAALPLATRFATFVQAAATRLSELTQRARDSGALGRFFKLAGDTAAQLGRIVGNLAGALLNVGKAAFGSGRSLLTSFEGATRKLRELTGSVSGQNQLRTYFENARLVVLEVSRLIADVGAAFARLGANPALAPLIKQVRTQLLPAFERLSQGLSSEFGPKLVELATRVVNIFAKLTANGGGLNSFLGTLNRMAAGFERILDSPLGPVVQQLLKIAGTGAALGLVAGAVGKVGGNLVRLVGIGTGFVRFLGNAARAMKALNLVLRANPIGLVITAIGLLVAGLVIAYKKSETFRRIVDGAFRAVASAGEWLAEKIPRFFTQLWRNVKIVSLSAIVFLLEKFEGLIDGMLTGLGAFAKVSDKVFGTNLAQTVEEAKGHFRTLRTGLNAELARLNDENIDVTARWSVEEVKASETRRDETRGSSPAGNLGGNAPRAQGRSRGGPVRGPGGPTDDLVPAIGPGRQPYRLSAGEWVFNARAVKGVGGFAGAAQLQRMAEQGALAQLSRLPQRQAMRYEGDARGRAAGGPIFGDGLQITTRTFDPARSVAAFRPRIAEVVRRTRGRAEKEANAAARAARAAARAAAAAEASAGLSGGGFSRGGKWPPARMGVVSANTAAAVRFARAKWGLNNIGTLGQRANKSDHPRGKAADFMTYRDIALGNKIASWFVANPERFGTKYVIFNRRINSGSGWRRYRHPLGRTDPTALHVDHPHVSFLRRGGPVLPPRGGTGLAGLAGLADKLARVPALRDGGIVRAQPGGRLAVLGEGGRDEAVVPLPRGVGARGAGGGGCTCGESVAAALARPRPVRLVLEDGRELRAVMREEVDAGNRRIGQRADLLHRGG